MKGADLLVELCGEDNMQNLGILSTVAPFRDNLATSANISFDALKRTYGDCSMSQLNCYNCRCAMYETAINYCLQNGIKFIAEGARKSQLFSIEQPPLLDRFRSLTKEFGIELLTPLKDKENDYDIDTKLLQFCNARSAPQIIRDEKTGKYHIRKSTKPNFIVPYEDKCILGMPIKTPTGLESGLKEADLDECTKTLALYFDAVTWPKMSERIKFFHKSPSSLKLEPARKIKWL